MNTFKLNGDKNIYIDSQGYINRIIYSGMRPVYVTTQEQLIKDLLNSNTHYITMKGEKHKIREIYKNCNINKLLDTNNYNELYKFNGLEDDNEIKEILYEGIGGIYISYTKENEITSNQILSMNEKRFKFRKTPPRKNKEKENEKNN